MQIHIQFPSLSLSLSLYIFSLFLSEIMNPAGSYGEYEKNPPTAPTATGIPVSSMNQSYSTAPPPAVPIRSRPPVPWSTGLCHCCDDIPNCCMTFWCPCVTFGRISEIVDRGSSSCVANGALYTLILWFTGCSCLYSCFYRSKMRGQYSLHEGACPDCIVHCCCESCALCQEYRELKHQGFDMSVGWHENVEKQTRGVQMVAPMEEGMNR